MFHHEEWTKTIRPKVVEKMKRKYPKGPFTSKHPKWLKMMKKVEARRWLTMSDDKRKDYIRRADEMNRTTEFQKAKAEYVILIAEHTPHVNPASTDTPTHTSINAYRSS